MANHISRRGERGAAWSTEKDYPGLSQKSAVYVCTYMDKICIFHLHINACHSLGHFFLSCPENGYGEKERETGRSGVGGPEERDQSRGRGGRFINLEFYIYS